MAKQPERPADLKDNAQAGDRKLSALDRAIQQIMGDNREVGLTDDPAKERWPNLWQWLTQIYIGRDYMRQPGVLNVRMGPEGCLVSVVDRDMGRQIEASTPHLADAFDAIEKELQKPNPNMKTWGKAEGKLRKRKSGN